MVGFVALNVEPEENLEDDVEDIREIQIEEALKLLQAAIKAQAKGNRHLEEATQTWAKFFESEVFKYRESLVGFSTVDASWVQDSAIEFSEDSSHNLPLILCAAHKNYARHLYNVITHRQNRDEPIPFAEEKASKVQIVEQICYALNHDPTDANTWLELARAAEAVACDRIRRYALEASFEVDDDPNVKEIEPTCPEEGIAGVLLKEYLSSLDDDLSLSHAIFAPYANKRLNQMIKKLKDPYPALTAYIEPDQSKLSSVPKRTIITINDFSWLALGMALLEFSLQYPGSNPVVQFQFSPEVAIPGSIDHNTTHTQDESHALGDLPESVEEVTLPLHSLVENTREVTAAEVAPHQSKADDENSGSGLKRTHSAAAIKDELEEEGTAHKRSKRIRNRDTIGPEGLTVDPIESSRAQLTECHSADEHMFDRIGTILEKLQVEGLRTHEEVRRLAEAMSPAKDAHSRDAMISDLQRVLRSWDDKKATDYARGNKANVLAASSEDATLKLTTFVEHSSNMTAKSLFAASFHGTEGLVEMVDRANTDWMPLQDAIFQYFMDVEPSYCNTLWSEQMKRTAVQLMCASDPFLHTRVSKHFDCMAVDVSESSMVSTVEVAQMLYELHLDLYTSITNPGSKVEEVTRKMEHDRLEKWSFLLNDMILWSGLADEDPRTLRFLWSATLFVSLDKRCTRQHIINCWNDTSKALKDSQESEIYLPNNAAMPEVSVAAVDRELSRLKTTDFFENLFNPEAKDSPQTLIDRLAPVLDPMCLFGTQEDLSPDTKAIDLEEAVSRMPATLRDAWSFLQGGKTSLRVFLWQRLRELYESECDISKTFSCHLRCIETVMDELTSSSYTQRNDEGRERSLLNWFKTIDDLLVKSLTIALNDTDAFEVIDLAHIRSTATALCQLCRLLHSATIFDDAVRVGRLQQARSSVHGKLETLLIRLREMQIRAWALLYTMVKEGISQQQDSFPEGHTDLADFLGAAHYSFSLRSYCKISNKIFMKMMKVELFKMKDIRFWEDYQGPVLFDLYGLRLEGMSFELQDHGCPTEPLDRRTALQVFDKVVDLTKKMSHKELNKSELRSTIEKLQMAVGPAKATPTMQHNLRNFNEYLLKSLRTEDIEGAMRGKLVFSGLPVKSPESPLAEKHWYFLLGMISLTKFKLQKRQGPGGLDDLKVALSFFKLQVQFTSDHWETWYRLAQCFDAELEEEVLWNAENLTRNRSRISSLQRHSILCYCMARSYGKQGDFADGDLACGLAEMTYDFAVRLYTASRAPFERGGAFSMDMFEKYYSGPTGMYVGPFHPAIRNIRVWKWCVDLLLESIRNKPGNWLHHYLLAKCYWKICQCAKSALANAYFDRVLVELERAMEFLPKRGETILEPIFKMVSIVHKGTRAGYCNIQKAVKMLQSKPYAVPKAKDTTLTIHTTHDFDEYILERVRILRNIDKAHWQHRFISKISQLVLDLGKEDGTGPAKALHEFQQNVFTAKTMQLTVWKPEYERLGRHAFYTTQYLERMFDILEALEDKTNMELLARRLRKKPGDVWEFSYVWSKCCVQYCDMARRAANIAPSLQEIALKEHTYESFTTAADALEKWLLKPTNGHPALIPMKEAEEFKKLNNNLYREKPNVIDELLGDAYSTIFLEVGQQLDLALPLSAIPATTVKAVIEAMPCVQGPMSLNNLVSNMEDASSPPNDQKTAAAIIAEAPKIRARPLTRKELLRRAEAIVAKLAEAPKPTAVTPTLATAPQTITQADDVPDGDTLGEDEEAEDNDEVEAHDEIDDGDDEGGDLENAEDGHDETSERGSLHDSADESDLSDMSGVEPQERDEDSADDIEPVDQEAMDLNDVNGVDAEEFDEETVDDNQDVGVHLG